MKYRRKPVEVEAIQYTGDNLTELRGFVAREAQANHIGKPPGLHTRDGVAYFVPGDWVIRNEAGEFYSCKPEIFALDYEPL